MRRTAMPVLTVVALLVLAVAAMAQPPAAPGRPGGPGGWAGAGGRFGGPMFGTVQEANAQQVVIAGRGNQPARVGLLTAETVVVRAEPGTREDVKQDVWAALSGDFDDEGVLNISRVQVGDAVPTLSGMGGMGFARGATAVGQISALEGNEITISLEIKLPELGDGTPISVRGTLDEDGNVVPAVVGLGDSLEAVSQPFRGATRNALFSFGTISGMAEGTLTLSLTATLQPILEIARVTVGEPADIVPGGMAFINGDRQDDGEVLAQTVIVGDLRNVFGQPGGGPGGGPPRGGG